MVVFRGPGVRRGHGPGNAHRLQPDGERERQSWHGGRSAQRQRQRQDANRARGHPVPGRLVRPDVPQHRGPDHQGPAAEGRQPRRGRGGAEGGPHARQRPAPRQRFHVQDRRPLRQRRGARDSIRGAGQAEQHEPFQGVCRLGQRERHDEADGQRRPGGRRQRQRRALGRAAHPARPAGSLRADRAVRRGGIGWHDAGHAPGLDRRPHRDRSDRRGRIRLVRRYGQRRPLLPRKLHDAFGLQSRRRRAHVAQRSVAGHRPH